MDHKWLDDLVLLARERSFSKAAALRHVTQPQFSRRIRALELWAGAELVNRVGVPLSLTAAGEALLPAARSATHTLLDARERIRRAQGGHSWVTLATGRTLSRALLPRLFAAAQKRAEFQLRVITGSLHDMVIALEQGGADLLLCYAHPRLALALSDAQFEGVTLTHESLVAVSALTTRGTPLHKLPGTEQKTTALLGYSPSLAMQQILQDALARRNAQLHTHVVVEADFAELLHELALSGAGVAWLPRALVAADLASGKLVNAFKNPDAIDFEVRLYRPRAVAGERSALLDKVWERMIASSSSPSSSL
jgi:LysR family transcriptional regulator, hypochlorite-specific transcription factor HypT